MPFYQLDEELLFPPVEHALTDPDGLLATGGDLSFPVAARLPGRDFPVVFPR